MHGTTLRPSSRISTNGMRSAPTAVWTHQVADMFMTSCTCQLSSSAHFVFSTSWQWKKCVRSRLSVHHNAHPYMMLCMGSSVPLGVRVHCSVVCVCVVMRSRHTNCGTRADNRVGSTGPPLKVVPASWFQLGSQIQQHHRMQRQHADTANSRAAHNTHAWKPK